MNRCASLLQLRTTLSGHTTRCGPGRSTRWASVVAVLPRPMSSARQPPRPSLARNCIHDEAAPLVVPEFADEVLRLHGLLEHLVGQAVEQGAHPVEVDRLGPIVVLVERGGVGGRLAERIGVGGSSPARRTSARSSSLSSSLASRSSSSGWTRLWSRLRSCSCWRLRRSSSASMRTHRCPVCSSDEPASAARASSASEIGSSPTTIVQSTAPRGRTACAGRRPAPGSPHR